MPRDKTETHNKLVQCMRAEFLEKGFEKASLNHIARQCGITPAAVYRHYAGKEAMFDSIVQPALQAFGVLCEEYMAGMSTEINAQHGFGEFSPYDEKWFRAMLELIYQYFDEFRLLVVCSKGTKYENYVEGLIEAEVVSTQKMLAMMNEAGMPHKVITEGELHIVVTAYITAILELIRHNLPKEEAVARLEFIFRFFGTAWKNLLIQE